MRPTAPRVTPKVEVKRVGRWRWWLSATTSTCGQVSWAVWGRERAEESARRWLAAQQAPPPESFTITADDLDDPRAGLPTCRDRSA